MAPASSADEQRERVESPHHIYFSHAARPVREVREPRELESTLYANTQATNLWGAEHIIVHSVHSLAANASGTFDSRGRRAGPAISPT